MAGTAPDLSGRVAVVTGANRGIGRSAAEGLARLGARVVLVCRRREDGEAAAEGIRAATGNDALEVATADLASQAAIRALAADLVARHPAIHVLVNNAAVAPKARQVSPDGIELTFAVNHLAYYLLTRLLLPALRAGAPARVVSVSSRAHYDATLDFDDLFYERDYGGVRAYARSKLCNVLFTRELAHRLAGTGVTANCLHPGVIGTNLLLDWFPWQSVTRPLLLRVLGTPEDGADTIVWLASAPEVAATSGRYFTRRRERRPGRLALDDALARRLWDESARLTGLPAALER